jgi:hypothetical protein
MKKSMKRSSRLEHCICRIELKRSRKRSSWREHMQDLNYKEQTKEQLA